MRLASPIMTAQKSGSIINLSSVLGFAGTNRTAYCVAKAATNSMTELVARELGAAGVRVNAISPGSVSGELMDQIITARAAREGRPREAVVKESYIDIAVLKRFVEPEEIARAALFLASDASSAMTGQIVKVDCGRF